MIIGNGLVASLFKDSDLEDVIFFASGVSNSLETDPAQFLREKRLILKTIEEHPHKTFIYFSTCSIYDSSKTESPYVLHKLEMEQLVSHNCPQYLILRLSNVVGKGGNPNLLMNYLIRSVDNGDLINVHTKATRNLIDAEDVKNITQHLIKEKKLNRMINMGYLENYSIIEILEIIEHTLQKKLNLNLIKAGAGYEIALQNVITDYFYQNHLQHKEKYLSDIISKYYIS